MASNIISPTKEWFVFLDWKWQRFSIGSITFLHCQKNCQPKGENAILENATYYADDDAVCY